MTPAETTLSMGSVDLETGEYPKTRPGSQWTRNQDNIALCRRFERAPCRLRVSNSSFMRSKVRDQDLARQNLDDLRAVVTLQHVMALLSDTASCHKQPA